MNHDGYIKLQKFAIEAIDWRPNVYIKKLAVRLGLIDKDGNKTKILTEEESRTSAQNRLLFMWYTDMQNTQIEQHKGHTKIDWHKRMKEDFLIPIYIRDDPGYSEMVLALRDLRDFEGYEAIRNGIMKLTSTRDANVKQFAEYLNDIEMFCHQEGIFLRTDGYLYSLAMGIVR